MNLNSYLFFDGSCKQAFAFYEQALDAKIESLMTWADGPMADEIPAADRDRVMHASLLLGTDRIMGSDEMPASNYTRPTGMRVVLNADSPEDAERFFANLSTEGHIDMPMEETFWAQRFGMLSDKFGIPWMVNCDKAEV